MGELLVLADEHFKLLIVNTDVLFKHPLWQSAPIVYILKQKRENHIGIVHRSLAVCVF